MFTVPLSIFSTWCFRYPGNGPFTIRVDNGNQVSYFLIRNLLKQGVWKLLDSTTWLPIHKWLVAITNEMQISKGIYYSTVH